MFSKRKKSASITPRAKYFINKYKRSISRKKSASITPRARYFIHKYRGSVSRKKSASITPKAKYFSHKYRGSVSPVIRNKEKPASAFLPPDYIPPVTPISRKKPKNHVSFSEQTTYIPSPQLSPIFAPSSPQRRPSPPQSQRINFRERHRPQLQPQLQLQLQPQLQPEWNNIMIPSPSPSLSPSVSRSPSPSPLPPRLESPPSPRAASPPLIILPPDQSPVETEQQPPKLKQLNKRRAKAEIFEMNQQTPNQPQPQPILNIGNTCFYNALIQVLRLPPYSAILSQSPLYNEMRKDLRNKTTAKNLQRDLIRTRIISERGAQEDLNQTYMRFLNYVSEEEKIDIAPLSLLVKESVWCYSNNLAVREFELESTETPMLSALVYTNEQLQSMYRSNKLQYVLDDNVQRCGAGYDKAIRNVQVTQVREVLPIQMVLGGTNAESRFDVPFMMNFANQPYNVFAIIYFNQTVRHYFAIVNASTGNVPALYVCNDSLIAPIEYAGIAEYTRSNGFHPFMIFYRKK